MSPTSMPEAVLLLRPACVNDVAAMFHVRLAVVENPMSVAELAAIGVTPQSIAQAIADAGSNPCAWVVTAGEQVVGFAMVDLDDACLFALFVLPAHEGQGIGARLLAACEQALWGRHDRAWLETAEGSRAAGWYRHWGWGHDQALDGGDVRLEKRRSAHADTQGA